MNCRARQTAGGLRCQTVVSKLRRMAFWGAIVLPLAYVPLLSSPVVLSGPLTRLELLGVVALVGLNVVSLVLGHEYTPRSDTEQPPRP